MCAIPIEERRNINNSTILNYIIKKIYIFFFILGSLLISESGESVDSGYSEFQKENSFETNTKALNQKPVLKVF